MTKENDYYVESICKNIQKQLEPLLIKDTKLSSLYCLLEDVINGIYVDGYESGRKCPHKSE